MHAGMSAISGRDPSATLTALNLPPRSSRSHVAHDVRIAAKAKAKGPEPTGRIDVDHFDLERTTSRVFDSLNALMGVLPSRGVGDHSITLSARFNRDAGIVRPSAFAVLTLITNWNFVGCSTGKSPGFAPLRILST